MTGNSPARLPKPPYYAVIFANQRRDNGNGDDGYGAMAERMVELAASMPGYLGIESVRGADGFGITISYWRDEAAIRNWRENAEHAEARRRGRLVWYADFELRVAKVERAYGMHPREEEPA